MNPEVIFSDLGSLCKPSEAITEKRLKDKWSSYPYETHKCSGSMLISPSDGKPEDVCLPVSLFGWYKIYAGLYGCWERNAEIALRLSQDEAFTLLSSCTDKRFHEHFIEDVFWRCAKMDNQSVIIGKHLAKYNRLDAAIAWIRFVPMNEEEIDSYLEDIKRQDTKRIYAANDMHNLLCFYDTSRAETWKSVVQGYIDSDVEWLAIESLSSYDAKIKDCSFEDFSFTNSYHKSYYEAYFKHYSWDALKNIVRYGKDNNIKMCISKRVASWGMEYPEDKIFFENKFAASHKEYRCIDRDGDVTDYLSFMYPEVRQHLIDIFVKMAQTGCDAVQLLFTRGWPFILFEKPFVDLFAKRYGEDARELPLDDCRIVKLKCEIMTDFMRELKKRLCEVRGDNPIEIHAKVLFSVYDNLLVGLDVDRWAKEGLVDRIVSDERRIREILPDSVRMENNHAKIDLKKYTDYAKSSINSTIRYDYDDIFEPMADSAGVLRGPDSQQTRISEFMELENKYGITVYIEIMPRTMKPTDIKRKALEIYDAGCSHIGLWDTESRLKRSVEWSMWRRIGHKDELRNFDSGENDMYHLIRITKLGEKNTRNYIPMWAG